MKKVIKDSIKSDWFMSMQSEMARKEAEDMAIASGIKKKIYKQDHITKLKGNQTEYYLKQAYGLEV